MRLRSRAACGERPTRHRPTQEKFQSEQAPTHSAPTSVPAKTTRRTIWNLKRVPQCDAASLQNCVSPPRHQSIMETCQSQPRKSPFSLGSSASYRMMTAQNQSSPSEDPNNERRKHSPILCQHSRRSRIRSPSYFSKPHRLFLATGVVGQAQPHKLDSSGPKPTVGVLSNLSREVLLSRRRSI